MSIEKLILEDHRQRIVRLEDSVKDLRDLLAIEERRITLSMKCERHPDGVPFVSKEFLTKRVILGH